ncbi:MAG: hypothetical protein HKL96_01485 [Phycisphaerales bacterium]|nr:hypothetical protein [Phycisphaerales bacterium]
MKRSIRSLVMALSVASAIGMASTVSFAKATLKMVTVKGEILDMKCFSTVGATGRKHGKGCGKMCLNSGLPAGILVHGRAWTLVVDPHVLADYVGDKAKVTGQIDKATHVVIPSRILVMNHGAWKTVKLTTK